MVENTCNLLKSCKAPPGNDTNRNTVVTMATTSISPSPSSTSMQISTLVQSSSITTSSLNEFMSSTTSTIMTMAPSSTKNFRPNIVSYTTHTATNATVVLRPSSALHSESVMPTSSIRSSGMGSKSLFHSLVLILCFIIVLIY